MLLNQRQGNKQPQQHLEGGGALSSITQGIMAQILILSTDSQPNSFTSETTDTVWWSCPWSLVGFYYILTPVMQRLPFCWPCVLKTDIHAVIQNHQSLSCDDLASCKWLFNAMWPCHLQNMNSTPSTPPLLISGGYAAYHLLLGVSAASLLRLTCLLTLLIQTRLYERLTSACALTWL